MKQKRIKWLVIAVAIVLVVVGAVITAKVWRSKADAPTKVTQTSSKKNAAVLPSCHQ
ncbi:hypothetical protein [Amylolactobacillus amylophilus]|uniref:hypothetical protein n=1 Tax=Amylolactobacillus amylophilus TaxID=1603 RepID=UPI000B1D0DBF|nr:hypothetical protein [Amylolactobacillus amylophilus]